MLYHTSVKKMQMSVKIEEFWPSWNLFLYSDTNSFAI